MANLIPAAPLAVQDEAKTTPAKRTLAYQSPDSRMTLREGIEEYFRENPGLMDQSELPRDLGLGLRSHDVAHVVFGCDTSLVGEVILTRWSFLGITGSIRPYLTGFRRPETRGLFLDAFARFRLALLWPLVKFATIAFVRSFRMSERWPFEGYAEYLDHPLVEIRERFGIRVLGPV